MKDRQNPADPIQMISDAKAERQAGHLKNELELESIKLPYHGLVDFALSPYPMVKTTQRLLERQGWPFSTTQTRL